VAFSNENIEPQHDSVSFTDSVGWKARLSLRCQQLAGKSVLTERSHQGPLRLLKPLYPEGDAVCHAVIVHPPGGIVAGDELDIAITASDGGHLLVTTPGTQKWYRSTGQTALARTVLSTDASSALEWLPQETMVFDGARAAQHLSIRLEGNARFFGWEILCLGRTTRDEQFTRGEFRQRIELIRDDRRQWSEHMLLHGNDPLLFSPLGLAGQPVIATAWIMYPLSSGTSTSLLATVRQSLLSVEEHATAAASNPVDGLIVIKVIGSAPETVRHLLTELWSRIRFEVFATAPQIPRIWST
jgi:urease accessory protein